MLRQYDTGMEKEVVDINCNVLNNNSTVKDYNS